LVEYDIAHDLTMLLLKRDVVEYSSKDLAKEYKKIKQEIYDELKSNGEPIVR
jgi:chaperonin cofactor prefoldin